MSEARRTRGAWWRPYRTTLARLAPPLLGVLLRVLRWTLRIDTVGGEALQARWARGERAIISFWHNRLLVNVQRFLPQALVRGVAGHLFRPRTPA